MNAVKLVRKHTDIDIEVEVEVGNLDEVREAAKILKLPPYVRPVAIIPIGYSKKKITPSSRIDTKKLIHYNRW